MPLNPKAFKTQKQRVRMIRSMGQHFRREGSNERDRYLEMMEPILIGPHERFEFNYQLDQFQSIPNVDSKS